MASVKSVISGGGLVVAALGVLAWQYAMREAPAYALIGHDPSGSVERNCKGLRAETTALLDRDGFGEGSTIAFLVMGRDAANPQRSRAFELPVPIAPTDSTGRKRKEEAFRDQKTQLLDQVERACETAPDSPQSPVYELVKRGLAHLHSQGCAAGGHCYLLAKTDALDDAEPRLRSLLARSVKDPNIKVPAGLAGSLSNDGIDVKVCGVAELRSHHSLRRDPAPEVLERIWKSLFSDPQHVTFAPYCGR